LNSILPAKEVLPVTKQQESNCCSTTEDGSMICNLPQNGETATCKQKHEEENRLRQAGLFLLGCLTSPCCTPLFVPLVLSLFAGTTFALWLSQNLFWVYGLLSLISLASFAMLFRPKAQPKSSNTVSISSNLVSISNIRIGEKSHAEPTE
jgi:hypothetical protein